MALKKIPSLHKYLVNAFVLEQYKLCIISDFKPNWIMWRFAVNMTFYCKTVHYFKFSERKKSTGKISLFCQHCLVFSVCCSLSSWKDFQLHVSFPIERSATSTLLLRLVWWIHFLFWYRETHHEDAGCENRRQRGSRVCAKAERNWEVNGGRVMCPL